MDTSFTVNPMRHRRVSSSSRHAMEGGFHPYMRRVSAPEHGMSGLEGIVSMSQTTAIDPETELAGLGGGHLQGWDHGGMMTQYGDMHPERGGMGHSLVSLGDHEVEHHAAAGGMDVLSAGQGTSSPTSQDTSTGTVIGVPNVAEFVMGDEKYYIYPDGRIEKCLPEGTHAISADVLSALDQEGWEHGGGTVSPMELLGSIAGGNSRQDMVMSDAFTMEPPSWPPNQAYVSSMPSTASSTLMDGTNWFQNTQQPPNTTNLGRKTRQRHQSFDQDTLHRLHRRLQHTQLGNASLGLGMTGGHGGGAWTTAVTTPSGTSGLLDPIAEAMRELAARNQPGFVDAAHGIGAMEPRPASADTRMRLMGAHTTMNGNAGGVVRRKASSHRKHGSVSNATLSMEAHVAVPPRPQTSCGDADVSGNVFTLHPSMLTTSRPGNQNAGSTDVSMEITSHDASSARHLQPIIDSYAQALSLDQGVAGSVPGELSVVLMTARVAQKSYGTEKRFLCPPPQVILQGRSWWSHESKEVETEDVDEDGEIFSPPLVAVGIPQDGFPLQFPFTGYIPPGVMTGSATEWWMPGCGGAISEAVMVPRLDRDSRGSHSVLYPDDMQDIPREGRLVARQLHIADSEEKRRWVHVALRARLASGIELGEFSSLPVKVISKPSKKRQMCIHHGSTISLFNRVRSQTISTKYLAVSSMADVDGAVPLTKDSPVPWHSPGGYRDMASEDGSGTENTDASVCFVARTGGWDAFVIWLVDKSAPGIRHILDARRGIMYPDTMYDTAAMGDESSTAAGSGTASVGTTLTGYPEPPPCAQLPRQHLYGTYSDGSDECGLPLTSAHQELIPIHYNQLVVLQCLSTGMVSPLLRIRRVDKTSVVIGGVVNQCGDEVMGDPVSQLHKVAFEYSGTGPDPSTVTPNAVMNGWFDGPGVYLSLLGNDVVGLHKQSAGHRVPLTPNGTSVPSTPVNATTPVSWPSNMDLSQAMQAAMDHNAPAPTGRRRSTHFLNGIPELSMTLPGSSTQSSRPASSHVTHRVRRTNSVGSLDDSQVAKTLTGASTHPTATGVFNASGSTTPVSTSIPTQRNAAMTSNAYHFANAWSEDVSDMSVWTIVGTESIRYTFYHPSTALDASDQQDKVSYTPWMETVGPTPMPVDPVTPLPIVYRIIPWELGDPSDASLKAHVWKMEGDGFSSNLIAWFGTRCSSRTEFHSSRLMYIWPPADAIPSAPNGWGPTSHSVKVEVLLARLDGIVYRTGHAVWV